MRETLRNEEKANPEHSALVEYVTQLKAKFISPEAFFRLCDTKYAKEITSD